MGRYDNGLDEYCMKKAKENQISIQINFSNILNKFRRSKSYEMLKISENIRLCNELDVPLILNSDAHNKWELRSPRDLIALTNILGLELQNAFKTLTTVPLNIIEKNKKRMEGKIIGKGVEIE